MQEVPVTQARAALSDLVNRVVYGGERVVLTRHGRPVAAIVSAADLQRLTSDEPDGATGAGPQLMVLDSGASGVRGPASDVDRAGPGLRPAAASSSERPDPDHP